MPETPNDVSISSTEFVSFNTLSGLPVGTATRVVNKGSSNLLVIESATKPADASTIGTPVSATDEDYAIFEITSGSLEIWIKANPFPSIVTYSV